MEVERPAVRYGYAVATALVCCAFFFTAVCFWVPAHGGVDQHGYLVGGKLLAETFTMGHTPTRPGLEGVDPHGFVGRMWVGMDFGTEYHRHYPKYPIGLPLLYACCFWLGELLAFFGFGKGVDGMPWGPWLSYWVSPVAMTAAVAGTFLLGRRVAGSFPAFLAALVFATSPTTLALTTNPNSHATAVACAVLGLWLLLRWWQEHTVGLAAAVSAFMGGFFLGYGVTIRYTEGTLLLALLFVAVMQLRPGLLASWRNAGLAVLGWAIPVGFLMAFNLGAMRSLTGYDPTNESGGFRLEFFIDNWETMFRQMGVGGLFFVFPLSLASLTAMFWWRWRVATLFALWVVPCLLIYTFYYWAPDSDGTGYLRFFLTVMPALAITAFWVLGRLRRKWRDHAVRLGRWQVAAVAVLGLLVAALSVPLMVSDQLRDAAKDMEQVAEAGVTGDAEGSADTPPSVDAPPGSFREAFTARYALEGPSTETMVPLVVMFGVLAAAAAAAAMKRRSAVPTLLAGALGLIATGGQLETATGRLVDDQARRLVLATDAKQVLANVPAGAILFCDDTQLLHQLDFVGRYILYGMETFDEGRINRLASQNDWRNNGQDDAQTDDPGYRAWLVGELDDLKQADLQNAAKAAVADAAEVGRASFAVVTLSDREYADYNRTDDRRRDHWLLGRIGRELQREVVATWEHTAVDRTQDSRVARRRNTNPWPRIIRGSTATQVWELKPEE